MNNLYDNYHRVKDKVAKACQSASRPESEVTLVAVSKLHSIEAIKEIASYGQKDFGENYIQEALGKITQIPELNWHAIGPVQSKKTKEIIGKFTLIHTLSSPSFLAELEKRLPKNTVQNVLLQVNIGQEEQKSGLLPEDCAKFLEKVLMVDKIKLQGLMCLPPYHEDENITRPFFVQMRKLKEKLEQEFQVKIPHLSMGMSTDFVAAIEEGATIVRVGSDIFGTRPVK